MMPRLYKYLHEHLAEFLSANKNLAYDYSSKEIMDKIFSENMIRFIIKYYNNSKKLA